MKRKRKRQVLLVLTLPLLAVCRPFPSGSGFSAQGGSRRTAHAEPPAVYVARVLSVSAEWRDAFVSCLRLNTLSVWRRMRRDGPALDGASRQEQRRCMAQREAQVDWSKIEEVTLALMHLTSFDEHGAVRSWKGYDWEVLNRLHERGWIDNPVSKAKSVRLTEEGARRSHELFEKHFAAAG